MRIIVVEFDSNRESILDLLSAPAWVSFPHVGGRFDGRHEFQSDISETNDADDRTGDDAEDVVVQHEGSDEDVDLSTVSIYSHRTTRSDSSRLTATTSKEREEERSVAVDIIRDLGKEFETAHNYRSD
jgi:hypothetical protein